LLQANKLTVKVNVDDALQMPKVDDVYTLLLKRVVADADKKLLCDFVLDLYAVYKSLHFTYLEINPLGMS
jgi:succinyl-CoA synthetase beta subunit